MSSIKNPYIKLLLIAILVISSLHVEAQSKMSPYTRSFVEVQSLAPTDSTAPKIRQHFNVKSVGTQEYVDAFIYLKDAGNTDNLTDLGVIVDANFGTFVTARIPVAMVEAVAAIDNVTYVELGTPVESKMNRVRQYTRVNEVHEGTGLPHAYEGKGVIVGVVDQGFEYTHPNFYSKDGKTLRIKRVWNQNKSGVAPEGYTGGAEYKTPEDIIAAGYDDTTDEVGHGTHVAGIAAGAYISNNYYGIARRADIALVSLGSTNVSLLNGVKYLFDYAESEGKPMVVNLSLGSHIGPHDGTSTFDRACDALLGSGKLLVGAAGNEGSDLLHLSKTFTGAATDSVISCVAFTYGSRGYYFSMIDMWGAANQPYSVRVAIVEKATGTLVSRSEAISSLASDQITFSPNSSAASGRISLYSEQNGTNNKGNISIQANFNSLSNDYALAVIVYSSTEGKVHAWTDNTYSTFTNNSHSFFTNGDAQYSVGEIGGTGNRIISAGAYTTNVLNGGTMGRIASFSSQGPIANERIKPDVAAPGNVVVSSVPNTSAVKNNMQAATNATVNGKTQYWAYMSGTSMASPAVAGIVALWLEANPYLTPEDVLEIIKETSLVDSYTGSVPNTRWGYGKINAQAGLLKAYQMNPDTIENPDQPSVVALYPNPSQGEFNLMMNRKDNNVVVSVYATNGQLVSRTNFGTVSIRYEAEVNISSVPDGVYIVKVKGDNSIDETFRMLVRH